MSEIFFVSVSLTIYFRNYLYFLNIKMYASYWLIVSLELQRGPPVRHWASYKISKPFFMIQSLGLIERDVPRPWSKLFLTQISLKLIACSKGTLTPQWFAVISWKNQQLWDGVVDASGRPTRSDLPHVGTDNSVIPYHYTTHRHIVFPCGWVCFNLLCVSKRFVLIWSRDMQWMFISSV